MSYKLSDVPQDVQLVWIVQSLKTPLGKMMVDKCIIIMKLYPEWFPDYSGQELPILKKKLK